MSDREEFEQRFPVPYGVKWSEKQNDYTYEFIQALQVTANYSGQWQAWQAARAQGGQDAEVAALTGRIHELKADPTVFSESMSGRKPWEIRKNDRDYRAGDTVVLRETTKTGAEIAAGAQLQFTGRTATGVISFVLDGPAYGLSDGWCIFSLYTQPQPAVPEWKSLEALADEYVEGYEFRGDEGDYQPNDRERFLIEDCAAGLMDEVHQMMKRTATHLTTPQADGWVRCGDRLPTEDDSDCFNQVWLTDVSGDGLQMEPWQVDWSFVTKGSGHWMPTGLKRPQPPKEGE